jgi:hypothetical protein
MKRLLSILFLACLPLISLSCTRDATYILAAAYSDRILVAEDKEMIERMIECAVTGKCAHLSVMELLPSRKAFLVEAGTKVAARGGLFSFSNARKVHILEGKHSGEDGWVYDRMLCQDRSAP